MKQDGVFIRLQGFSVVELQYEESVIVRSVVVARRQIMGEILLEVHCGEFFILWCYIEGSLHCISTCYPGYVFHRYRKRIADQAH